MNEAQDGEGMPVETHGAIAEEREGQAVSIETPRPAPDRAMIKRILEGALLAAGETLNVDRLGTLFEDHERPDASSLRDILAELSADYEGRGIELREVASGFRFQVRKELGPWVSRLWTEKAPRYSRALMETLALIAYRQPITRGEIEEVRGVTVSSDMIKSLLERDWIRVVGHRDVPGRPALYATTHDFLDYFDLKSLDELPTLSEIRDLDKVNEELQLEMAPAEAILAAERAPVEGAGEAATGQQFSDAAPERDDLDLSADMQQVDEVLKRVEESFRRKEADAEGVDGAGGDTVPGEPPATGNG
ncbi:MAG: SMC-Scp complex subunit ScpB [Gammaproteobacteria bacterium]